jgi:hypothetical protein
VVNLEWLCMCLLNSSFISFEEVCWDGARSRKRATISPIRKKQRKHKKHIESDDEFAFIPLTQA